MQKSLTAVLLFFAVICLISWGYEGHQTIARIAENHLTPNAKAAIRQLLGDQPITEIASWADEVRNEPEWKYTAPWHFVNVPDGLNVAEFKNAVEHDANPNLYSALMKCETEIADPNVAGAQKAIDLKFIVHLVGDTHQPMHVSRAADKGGNTIQVQFDGKGTNLHSIWDTKLIDHQELSYAQIATEYDKLTPAEIAKLQSTGPLDWMFESYQISARLYREVEQNNKLDNNYFKQHIGIVDERIEQAGIRLAGVLNNLIKNGVVIKDGPVKAVANDNISQTPVAPAKTIDAKQAGNHYNETVTITSKVFGYKDFGSMVLVNLGGAYPDQLLTIVLRGDAKAMAAELSDKIITVMGKLVEFKGKPEIFVTDKTQLKIK